MRSKAQQRRLWTYQHIEEIESQNYEFFRQQEQQRPAAAAAAAAAAAPAAQAQEAAVQDVAPLPLVLQPLAQEERILPLTPPHQPAEVAHPPPRPHKTPPSPARVSDGSPLQQRLQQAAVRVKVTLSNDQAVTPSVINTPAKEVQSETSVTSSSSGSAATSAFSTPQQELTRTLPTAAPAEKGFLKTLAAGLDSITSSFIGATPVVQHKSPTTKSDSEGAVTSKSKTIDTVAELIELGAHQSVSSEQAQASDTTKSPCALCSSSRKLEAAASTDNIDDLVIVCTCGKVVQPLLCPVHDDPLRWSKSTHPSNQQCVCPRQESPKKERRRTRYMGEPQGTFDKSTQVYTSKKK